MFDFIPKGLHGMLLTQVELSYRIPRLPTRFEVDAGEAEGFLDAAPHALQVHHQRLRMGRLAHTLHHLQQQRKQALYHLSCPAHKYSYNNCVIIATVSSKLGAVGYRSADHIRPLAREKVLQWKALVL